MKTKNAIIIHGPGRSGTTLLNSILSLHGDLSWVSGYVSKLPNFVPLTVLNRMQNIHLFESLNRGMRKFPRPSEPYGFFHHYFEHFGEGDLSDLTPANIEACQKAIGQVIKWHGNKRFITKLTGNSRYEYLNAVFDNPFIAYIDRDPRAVTMSYYKQRWGYKRNTTAFKSMAKPELIKEYADRYLKYYEEKKKLMQFNDFVQLYYEDMVLDFEVFFENLLEKLELDFNPGFERTLKSWTFHQATNRAYLKLVSPEENDLLNELLAVPIAEMGYNEERRDDHFLFEIKLK